MADIVSIGSFLTIASAAIVTIIAQIQQSKCKMINLFCGLVKCTREVPHITPTDEMKKEIELIERESERVF